ncbi:hypothetical protein KEM55_002404 [Ascosphaera atra]|nr:hypothetical protein KEM55_002404 [Ascosphaera atra]
MTSDARHADANKFYKQTVDAMAPHGSLSDPGQVPPKGKIDVPLPAPNDEEKEFRKLKPSPSEQDKQAVAPERQIQNEREERRKKKEKQQEKLEDGEEAGKSDKDAEVETDKVADDDDEEGSSKKNGKKKPEEDEDSEKKGTGKEGKKGGPKKKPSDVSKEDNKKVKGQDEEKAQGKGKGTVVKGDEEDEDEDAGKTKDSKVEAEFQAILKRSPVIIFSKTYCPFSKKAKYIMAKYTIVPAPFIVELDEHPLGEKLQAMLAEITGRSSVPNILVNGKSLGGGDEVEALHQKGSLIKEIKDVAGKQITQIRLRDSK